MIAGLIARARRRGFPIVYTQEMHRADESDFGIELHFEPLHCLEGTEGLEVVDALKPEDGDLRISNKRRDDAFLGTDLDLVLRCAGRRGHQRRKYADDNGGGEKLLVPDRVMPNSAPSASHSANPPCRSSEPP